MKKRVISLVLSAALALGLTACAPADAVEEATQQATVGEETSEELVGKITELNGSQVTVQLGTLAFGDRQQLPEGNDAPVGKPEGQQGDGQQPPEKPDEAQTGGQQSGGQMPEKPDGQQKDSREPSGTQNGSGRDGQQPPELPDGQPGNGGFVAGDTTQTLDLTDAAIEKDGTEAAISDLAVGDILRIVLENGKAISVQVVQMQTGPQMDGGFGGSGTVTQGTSANTIAEDGTYSGEFLSSGDDENALRVDGAEAVLQGVTVQKTGGASSNTEDGDFYGMNAALLATNGAKVTITGAEIVSDAQNGNGVFSYGEDTTVTVSDSVITTSADNSGGIQTTGGGTTIASNLTVETCGNSSAAIRSDRGGGTVQVTGGTYTSNGLNSPAVYSTADITVSDADLTANHSEALVIEGKNSITLENCRVFGAMDETGGSSADENVHGVMIYQSMSGDAQVGTATFSMTGGSLTNENGDLIYVTNTHSVITLSAVALDNRDSDGALLRVVGNSASRGWGTAGSNGAQVEFTAVDQRLTGSILVDSISTLNMVLDTGTDFTGTVNILDNAQGGEAVADNAVVTIAAGAAWTLTGDCTLTSLENNGTLNLNGYTITLADGTVLR